MGSMLVLFGNFFLQSYVLKKPTARFGGGVVKRIEPVLNTRTYTGRAVLDASGSAQVQLPASCVGDELHYQLTPIGRPMPQLYIAEEPTSEKHHFTLAGGL